MHSDRDAKRIAQRYKRRPAPRGAIIGPEVRLAY
jgi:hypothetical protein